jgi:hypothetical protein
MPEADDPKNGSTEGGGFYRRWSRRKGLSRGGPDAEAASATPPAEVVEAARPASDPLPAQGPAVAAEADRVLTDADMPDLDSLGEGDDFSPFMSPGVSEALRRKALRKLFLGSAFNVTDGLDDYDDDFTTFEALGDLITSDMRHRMEREAERAREQAEGATAAQPEEGIEPGAEVEEARQEPAGAVEEAPGPVAEGGAGAHEPPSPAPEEAVPTPLHEAVAAADAAPPQRGSVGAGHPAEDPEPAEPEVRRAGR